MLRLDSSIGDLLADLALNSLNGVIAYATNFISVILLYRLSKVSLNSLNGVIAYATQTAQHDIIEAANESLNSLNGVIAYATAERYMNYYNIADSTLNSLNGVIAYATMMNERGFTPRYLLVLSLSIP